MTSRRLILMRHAKAEPFASTDRERVLVARGPQDALEAGAYLARTTAVPDHAVISSAVADPGDLGRGGRGVGVVGRSPVEESLFAGSPEVVLDVLRAPPDDATVVMFVGHNPTAA